MMGGETRNAWSTAAWPGPGGGAELRAGRGAVRALVQPIGKRSGRHYISGEATGVGGVADFQTYPSSYRYPKRWISSSDSLGPRVP